MRKINENDFESFSIVGNGWCFTVFSWNKALREWNNVKSGTLYGRKPNGIDCIIDTK